MIHAQRQTLARVLAGLSGLTFVLISSRLFLSKLQHGWLKDDYVLQSTMYNRTVLMLNYFDLGFVRRGLGGTITNLIQADFLTRALIFHIASAIFFSIALCYLIYRIAIATSLGRAAYLAIVLAISPQTFLGWSSDVWRTDMMIGGLLACAVIAVLHCRPVVGAIFLLIGCLAHETAIIFGAPLFLALLYRDHLDRKLGWRQAMPPLAVLGVGLIAILLAQKLFSPPPAVIAQYMLGQIPSAAKANDLALEAVYMTSSGSRGLATAICWNLHYNPQYYFMCAFALVIAGLYAYICGLTRRLLTFALVAIVPMLFMMAVANDTGRWLMMSVLNAWLTAAAFQIQRPDEEVFTLRRKAVSGAILVALLMGGSTQVIAVNKTANSVLTRAGFPQAGGFAGLMALCDPNWKTAL